MSKKRIIGETFLDSLINPPELNIGSDDIEGLVSLTADNIDQVTEEFDSPLKVLSLFDGLGALRVALDELGIPISEYLSSEIDSYPRKILKKNYPDIKELGDVTSIVADDVGNVDLMCGGSPCQDLSRGNVEGKGLEGDRSKLFKEFVRLKNEVKPKNFIFENVIPKGSLKDKDVEVISKELGVDPVILDAKDFSAASRPRMFFTDLPLDMEDLPDPDSLPKFKDILDKEVDPKYFLSDKAVDYMYRPAGKSGRDHYQRHGFDITKDKARTIPRVISKGVPYNALKLEDGTLRRLTPKEVEKLFGLPEDYTSGVSDTRRYQMLGNSMSVPVLKKLLQGLKKTKSKKKLNKGGLVEMAHGGLMTGDMSDGCGCPSCMMKKIMGVDMGMMNMMGMSDMVGVDPVSGNEIPPGSNAENVRDDLPVMLSDGEYVMPADAVRYHGLKFLDSLRMEAKAGLMAMMAEGQIQTIEEEEEAQQYVDDEDDEDNEEVQTYTTEEGNEVEEPEMEVTTKRMSMFMPYKPSQSFAFVK